MTRSTHAPVRRLTVILAMAGTALFTGVAVAPAASATEVVDLGYFEVIEGPGARTGNGPDAFLVGEHRRTPVFFCDAGKSQQRHNVCTPDPRTGPRW